MGLESRVRREEIYFRATGVCWYPYSFYLSVGLMPAAFPLIRALPKITRRENEVMGRGAGVERGACDLFIESQQTPEKADTVLFLRVEKLRLRSGQ